MVQSVKFNGYKSFSHGKEHEIDLSPYITLFIGKNNCGKSSCIDALETALMKNRYIETKNMFQEIAVSFVASDSEIRSYFSSSRGGGDGIPGNHYEHGKNYVGKKVFGVLQVGGASLTGGKTVEIRLQDSQNQIGLPAGKNNWDNLVRHHRDYQTRIDFRRINVQIGILFQKQKAMMRFLITMGWVQQIS